MTLPKTFSAILSASAKGSPPRSNVAKVLENLEVEIILKRPKKWESE